MSQHAGRNPRIRPCASHCCIQCTATAFFQNALASSCPGTASASREGSPHLSHPSPYPLFFPLPLLSGAFTQAAERAPQCVDAAKVRMHIQHEHRSLQSTLAGHSAFKGILRTPASGGKTCVNKENRMHLHLQSNDCRSSNLWVTRRSSQKTQ